MNDRLPFQPPSEDDERAIELAGLVHMPVGPSMLPRWSVPGLSYGVLYASHLPVPWGVYVTFDDGEMATIWSHKLSVALWLIDKLTK